MRLRFNPRYVIVLLTLFTAVSCLKEEDPDPSDPAAPSTGVVVNITPNSASLEVTLPVAGTVIIDAKGVCWSLNHNPTTTDTKTNEGSGNANFTSQLTGLTPATTYYVRSYYTSSGKTTYGNEVSFKTTELSLDGQWKTSSGNVFKINLATSTASSWVTYTPDAVDQAAITGGYMTSSTPLLKNIVKTSGTTWNCDKLGISYTSVTTTITNVNFVPAKIVLAGSGNSFTVSGTIPSGLGYPSSLVGQSFSYTYTRKN